MASSARSSVHVKILVLSQRRTFSHFVVCLQVVKPGE